MVFYYITHEVRVLGNPSQNQFNIVVDSSSDEKMELEWLMLVEECLM
jgi:hypothetical protein